MRKMAGWLAVCVALVPAWWSAASGAPKSQSSEAGDAPGENQGVQCGFHATVFALEYFAVDYLAANVASGLRVSAQGSSLAEIQELLSAFGLDASVREGVTLEEVAKRLDRETLAIVPLPVGNGLNHYFVAAVDNDGRSVIASVPYSVAPLPDDDAGRRLEKTGGVVLFVRRPSKRSGAMSDEIRVSPPQLDLGEFIIGGPKAVSELDASLSISNTSTLPIMVSSIQTPCGCIKVDWQGGVLRSGETRKVRFTVSARAWGVGTRDRAVLLTLGDASKLALSVHGVGMTPTEKQRLELSQDSVDVDLSDRPTRDPIEVRVTKVRAVGIPLDNVSVASGSTWLTPRLVPTENAGGELWAKLDMDRVMRELDKSSNRVTGPITLSTRSNEAPASVKVNVFRRDAFHLTQSVVRIRHGETSKVAILPSREGDRLKIGKVHCESSGLSVEANDEGKGIILAVRLGTGAIHPGYYLVKCTISSSTGKSGTATLVVQVVPEG